MRIFTIFIFLSFLGITGSEKAEAGFFVPRGRGLFPRIGRMPRGCGSGMCAPRRRGGCGSGMCGPQGGGSPQQGFSQQGDHGGASQQGFPGQSANQPYERSEGGRPIADEDVPAPSLDGQAADLDEVEVLSDEAKAGKEIFHQKDSCIKCHSNAAKGSVGRISDWTKDDWEKAVEEVKSGNMPQGKTLSPEERKNLIAYLQAQIDKDKKPAAQEQQAQVPAEKPQDTTPPQAGGASSSAKQESGSSAPSTTEALNQKLSELTSELKKTKEQLRQAQEELERLKPKPSTPTSGVQFENLYRSFDKRVLGPLLRQSIPTPSGFGSGQAVSPGTPYVPETMKPYRFKGLFE